MTCTKCRRCKTLPGSRCCVTCQEKSKERMRRLHQERLSRDRCVQCEEPLGVRLGLTTCPSCATAKSEARRDA